MARLLGIDLPNNKSFFYAIQYLYGIGPAVAADICYTVGIRHDLKAKDLSEDELARIAGYLDKECLVEGQLRRLTQQSISRLKEIQCYRGARHRRSLPVRGQRTRTNARTRKGVKKTVAGKKGVKDMKH